MARFGGSTGGGLGLISTLALVCVVSGLGGFIVLAGGASALQHKSATIAPLLNQLSTGLTFGDLAPQVSAADFISFEWFKAVFQVLTLLFVGACILTGQLRRTRIAQVGLLAVLAALWCNACFTFWFLHRYVNAAEAVAGQYIDRAVKTYFSGCVISAVFDFALIILLGISSELNDVAQPGYATTTTTGKGGPTYANGNENVGGNTAV